MIPARELAQFNIARPRAGLDDPLMAEFVANLDRINALAEASPGFVWRLQDESGNATGLAHPFPPETIVNLSLWQDIDALRLFTYKTEHAQFVRRRAAWFGDLAGPHLVLWWVPSGRRPSLAEARQRLDQLAAAGPSPEAFIFSRAFGPDGMPWRRGERRTA